MPVHPHLFLLYLIGALLLAKPVPGNSTSPVFPIPSNAPPNLGLSGVRRTGGDGVICAGDSIRLQINVFNAGFDTATVQTLRIGVRIDQADTDTVSWQGNVELSNWPPLELDLGAFPVPAAASTYSFEILEVNGEASASAYDTTSAVFRWGLRGTYDLGPNSPDFPDFRSAFAALQQQGVCGPTTFRVEPGEYAQRSSLRLVNLNGVSPNHPVVFKADTPGDAGVAFYDSSTYATYFWLENADHLTFSNLNIRGTSNFVLYAINSDYLQLDHTGIDNPDGYGLHTDGSAEGFSMTDSHVRVKAFPLETATVNPGDPPLNHRFWNIRDNIFEQSGSSKTLLFLPFLQEAGIDGNTFDNYLMLSGPSFTFENNRVTNDDLFNDAGVELFNPGQATLTNNLIADRNANRALLSITMADPGAIRLYHNTCIAESTGTAVAFNYAVGASGSLTAYNNNVVNYGSGPALYANCDTLVSQNNNYFSQQGVYSAWHNNLTYPGTAWKNTLLLDTASLSVLPLFLPGTAYLGFSGNELANRGLQLLDRVPADLNGEPRDAQPDLGASEFYGAGADLALAVLEDGAGTCHGIPAIRVRLANIQSARPKLHSARIAWYLNDTLQQAYEWRGELAAGDTSDWIEIGRHHFRFAGETLRVELSRPYNNESPANNLRVLPGHRRPLGGTYTIGRQQADFRTWGEAARALQRSGICDAVELRFQSGRHDAGSILEAIPGSSAANRIALTSEAADRDSARLEDIPDFNDHTDPQPFSLRDPGWIDVHDLTMYAGLNAFGNRYLRVERCRLSKVNIHAGGDSLILRKNTFSGEQAVMVTDSTTRLVFQENVLNMPGVSASTQIEGFSGALIEHNRFERDNRLNLTLGPGSRVSNNIFDDTNIAITGRLNGLENDPILVSNNLMGRHTAGLGGSLIDLVNSNRVRIWHNTFHATQNGPYLFTGVRAEQTSHLDIQNNLFSGLQYAYYFLDPIQPAVLDYNNFDGVGIQPYPANLNYAIPLLTWRDSLGFDMHSDTLDTVFQFETVGAGVDLHLDPNAVPPVRVANYLPACAYDVDYEYRDLQAPCVGADEAGGLPANAFVWPGDADLDKQVTHLDWLRVGLAAGQNAAGQPRADQTIDWAPKFAQDWATVIANINTKHADTDGNGAVNAADTLAIRQNFSKKHFLSAAEDRGGAKLVLKNVPPDLTPGIPVEVELHLEDESGLPLSLYGIAVTVQFHPPAVDPASLAFLPADGWLGTPGVNLWVTSWLLSNPLALQVACTRNDGVNAAGSGLIGRLRFTPLGNADSLRITVRNDLAVLNDGLPVPVGSENATFPVATATGTPEMPSGFLELYPNPAKTQVQVRVPEAGAGQLVFFDSFGRPVYVENVLSQGLIPVSLDRLPAGIYRVAFFGKRRVWNACFVKE